MVYNPARVDEARLRESVRRAEHRHGWRPSRWHATTEEDPGSGQAARALEEGSRIVLVAGGDGTVRTVAEIIAGSGVPLALLPMGTGNLLARNLELGRLSLDAALDTAFTGRDRPIDVGRVDIQRPGGHRDRYVFLVMAGLGLDAQMIANTDPRMKRRVGWLAYVGGIARSLSKPGNGRVRIRYRLDEGRTQAMTVHTILIGNCGSLPANILLLPDAEIDDGLFDIVALRPKGFFGWLRVWSGIVWENGVLRRSQVGRKIIALSPEARALRYLQGKDMVVRPDEPQEFQLDGDSFGMASAVRVWVEPGALIVRVPRAAR